MGLTNYQHALRKKYSALTGELAEVSRRIEQIERDFATLPVLQARTERLVALVESVAMLLKDDCRDWGAADSPPVRPWTHKLPVPFGSCGRRALDVLRLADAPLTVREITRIVLQQVGVDAPDRETLQRVQNAVDAALRSRRGRGVESSGKYPAQWRSVARTELEFGP